MAPMQADLIGTKEAADLLGCDRSTLTRKVTAGQLAPALRLGGATGAMLFHRSDVLALAEQTTGAAS